MSPQPLRCRLLGALELAPMTITQVSRCLDAQPSYVQRLIAELRSLGVVRETGSMRRRTCRPEKLWQVAA